MKQLLCSNRESWWQVPRAVISRDMERLQARRGLLLHHTVAVVCVPVKKAPQFPIFARGGKFVPTTCATCTQKVWIGIRTKEAVEKRIAIGSCPDCAERIHALSPEHVKELEISADLDLL